MMTERTKENLTLTPRLAAIAARVPLGARLADVGTDHGHLPLLLLREGRVRHAIASDIRSGPLEHARANARHYGLEEQAMFVLAPGLDGIRPEDCDVISIAGMGGETIAAILENAPWTRTGAHTLLLQPMTMAPLLRGWLWAHGYTIEEETVCREGRRLYVVLTVRGGGEPVVREKWDCQFSPALLRDPQAVDYLDALLQREQRALDGMCAGTVEEEQLETQRRITARIREAWEELKCRQ